MTSARFAHVGANDTLPKLLRYNARQHGARHRAAREGARPLEVLHLVRLPRARQAVGAGACASLGVGQGDTVAIIGDSRPDWVAAAIATHAVARQEPRPLPGRARSGGGLSRRLSPRPRSSSPRTRSRSTRCCASRPASRRCRRSSTAIRAACGNTPIPRLVEPRRAARGRPQDRRRRAGAVGQPRRRRPPARTSPCCARPPAPPPIRSSPASPPAASSAHVATYCEPARSRSRRRIRLAAADGLGRRAVPGALSAAGLPPQAQLRRGAGHGHDRSARDRADLHVPGAARVGADRGQRARPDHGCLAASSGRCSRGASSVGLRAVERGRTSGLAQALVLRALRDRLGFTRLRFASTGGAAMGPDTFKFFMAMGVPHAAALRPDRARRHLLHAAPRRGRFRRRRHAASTSDYKIRIDNPDAQRRRRDRQPASLHVRGLLQERGGDRAPICATAGCTPATPATSSRPASSSSSTA